MPRLRAIRLGVLESLADQLRFAPPLTIRRQLLRAQSLGMSLANDQTCTEGWLIEQITGFKTEQESPAVVPAQALQQELSAFLERLSDVAQIPLGDAPRGSLRLEQLASRWSVSSATIRRYRQRGLFAWRVRTEAGHPVLVFPQECISWFEQHEQDLLGKASSFSRLDTDARDKTRMLARRASRRFGWNQSQTAAQLALRTGRSPEAMRQLLQDDHRGEAVFLPRAAPSPALTTRICGELGRGTSPGAISRSSGMSTQTIRRLSMQHRIVRLEKLDLPEPAGAPELPREDLLARLPLRPMACDLGDWIRDCRADGTVDIELEIEAALAVYCWLVRASALRAGLRVQQPRALAIDAIETYLRCAAQMIERLVTMHRRTIYVSLESRLGCSLEVLGPADARLVYDASHHAAASVILHHLPSRSARVAGVITLAVDRAVASLLMQHTIHPPRLTDKAHTDLRAVASVTLQPWLDAIAPWSRWCTLSTPQRCALADLPKPLREVMELRFGGLTIFPRTMLETARLPETTLMAIARQQLAAMRLLPPREDDAPSGR